MLLLNLILALIVALGIFTSVGILTSVWWWPIFVVPLVMTFVCGIVYDVVSTGIVEWLNPPESEPDPNQGVYRG